MDAIPAAGTGRPSRRRTAIFFLKFVVSTALLALLFQRTDTTDIWAQMRRASMSWLVAALGLYFLMILASAWRWGQLLDAQRVMVPRAALVRSYLIATFFNNFLPSNIGGDVIRIRDTAEPAGSKTLATTVVLVDRAVGLMGLLLVGAVAASASGLVGGDVPVWPAAMWAGFGVTAAGLVGIVTSPAAVARVMSPLRVIHYEWIEERLLRLTGTLRRFRERPSALVSCFGGAVVVQVILVAFYVAVAHSVGIPIPIRHLAILVPLSFVVQMLPVSINGFGVREATFSYYFLLLNLPLESALVLSLLGTAVVLVFSLSGVVAYVAGR